MKLKELKPYIRVAYVPGHAQSEADHEHGYVSSINDKFAFVKFDDSFRRIGLHWHAITSQACDPKDLIPSKKEYLKIHIAVPKGNGTLSTYVEDLKDK